MTPTPISDNLHRIIGPEAHASSPTGKAGGEWDAWRHLSRRNRRRLIGAGYARRGGMAPDVLGTWIVDHGGPDEWRQALEWFYRDALLSISETRRAHRYDTRLKAARAAGHASYFKLRNAQAIANGYTSFWAQRKARKAADPTPELPALTHRKIQYATIAERRARRQRAFDRYQATRETDTCKPHGADRSSTGPEKPASTTTDGSSQPPPNSSKADRHLHLAWSQPQPGSPSAPSNTTSPPLMACTASADTSSGW